MTDNYGTEGNEEHHSEAWQDSQPPVDTFHDSDMGAEGVATVSEESGETEEFEKAAEQETAPKKKIPNKIIIMAVAGIVFVVGAVIFWQMSSNSSTPPVAVTMQAPPLRPQPAPMAPAPSSPSVIDSEPQNQTITLTEDGKLKLSDPATPMTDSTSPNTVTATNTPSAGISTGGTATPNAMGNPSAVTPNPAPMPDPVAAAPSQPSVPAPLAPSSMPMANTAAAPASVPTAAPPAQVTPATSDVDARLTALSMHVEDLQKSLDQATQQLSQVSTIMATKTASPAVDTVLEERLNKIEQHLSQTSPNTPAASPALPSYLSHFNPTNPTAAPSSSAVSNSTLSTNGTSAPTIHHGHHKKTRMVKASTSSKHRNVAKASEEPKIYQANPSAGVLETSHSSWVLRAATPNEAWVAKNATTSDLVHVRLGEDLPGVGQVQSIRPIGDNWVVEGTEGSIR